MLTPMPKSSDPSCLDRQYETDKKLNTAWRRTADLFWVLVVVALFTGIIWFVGNTGGRV